MVTITYDSLNDLIHEIADSMGRVTGLTDIFDRIELNNHITEYLQRYGIQFEESDLEAPATDPVGPAVSIAGVAAFGTSSGSPTRRVNRLVAPTVE